MRLIIINILLPIFICLIMLGFYPFNIKGGHSQVDKELYQSEIDTIFFTWGNSQSQFIGNMIHLESQSDSALNESISFILRGIDGRIVVGMNNILLFEEYVYSLRDSIVSNFQYLVDQGFTIKELEEPDYSYLISSSCDSIMLIGYKGDFSLEYYVTCKNGIYFGKNYLFNLKEIVDQIGIEGDAEIIILYSGLVSMGSNKDCSVPVDFAGRLFTYFLKVTKGEINRIEINMLFRF